MKKRREGREKRVEKISTGRDVEGKSEKWRRAKRREDRRKV